MVVVTVTIREVMEAVVVVVGAKVVSRVVEEETRTGRQKKRQLGYRSRQIRSCKRLWIVCSAWKRLRRRRFVNLILMMAAV